MTQPDQDVQSDVVKGLVAEREKLQRLAAEAAKVSAEPPAEIHATVDQEEANSWYNSRVAESIGFAAGHAIGEVLVGLGKSLIPTPEERERAAAARATARARAAAVVAPRSAPAAITVPAETPAPQPTPTSSESPLKGIDLVGHLDEDRRAPSTPTEPLSGHIERLDLETDVRDQVRQRKLSGPILGAEDPAAAGNHPHSGI